MTSYDRAVMDDERWECEHDSRKKIERDARVIADNWSTYGAKSTFEAYDIIALLDRQAAITERDACDCDCCGWKAKVDELMARECDSCAPMLDAAATVDELTAEADALRDVNGHLNGCVSELRARVYELQAELDHARACPNCNCCGWAKKVDELQAELDAYDETHMLLPVDADGVPIHCGERMRLENGHEGDVWLIGVFDIMMSDHTCFDWARSRHVKPKRTIEDVLADVVTLCANTWKDGESPFAFYGVSDVMESGNIKGYADELRWLGVDDDR